MLVILAGIFVVHIAVVVMLFVATIANVWMRNNNDQSAGIWKMCSSDTCTLLPDLGDNEGAMRAVQAFMILAIIFGFIALVAFIGQLFTLEKGCRFFITGAIMLMCWLCILIAASIYTARFPQTYPGGWYHGYCFILAWVCFCLSFLTGILYLVLRKK
ncbi:epithelial membrane protein 1 [Ambystoma mexicanum]|uniref:epithelial membrane protein 1 n=1 Tax=Ambystoma mexicanum TaxID=8296 RepID=UPI0037E7F181